jgi:exonuclease III
MVEYSAGIVTAYGSAKRAGYTGSYEDFCRQQAQYADNASAVEQAKQSAVQSAQSADQAKQDAQTASTQAQSASQSAQSASQSAGQSAVDAQTAESNAQTYAQSASASAGSAQQSAQTAQAVKDSIPEDYSDLSSDVVQLKADLGNMFSLNGDKNHAKIIPENSDLNNYTTIGNYRISSGTVGATIANMPVATAGRLLVMGATSGTADIQVYIATSNRLFIRSYNNGWRDWEEITTDVSREDVEKINSTAEKLYAWAQYRLLPFVVYDNSYINNMGGIRSYTGWSRTDYINVENATKVLIISTKNSTYNKFYDENKNGISAYDGNLTINIVIGENIVDVPANAKYMILSGEGTYANDVSVYVYQDKTQKEVNAIVSTYKKNALGKYYLILQPSDFENGKRIVSGEEATDTKYALSGYIKLLNTQNKYIFNMPAENGIYISQYELQEDGTFKFISKSSYIANGGEYWATTGVTHIRIEFYSTTDVTNNTSVIFCDTFSMEESNDINKYIRVCTFNQAADYPHFTRATEEDLNKRILNYLNFIGEYNPDVICAQEAVATYFQPISFEKSTSAVFNRKYLFPWYSGHQRRTWSKYNYGRKETVQFTAQVEGGTRFYSKQTLYYENKEIVILNAHCEYRGESNFELVRKAQFEELATEMAQHNYCICCGDFNAWSASEFNVFKDAGFTCANCGDYGVIDTWYVGTDYPDWPFKAVDNIIITPNIVIQNVERGPYDFDYFSDHAPLIADLQIR